ncbi:MAG TPA: DUF2817 domain-containing protein [Rhizomicrobium sp.]|nr:DUF2817 domain-containing protein [Rhizomicrobium sp.]
MVAPSESVYRAARRAFIAACEAAHVDPIARLHPSRGPDGKPLFMDCAALGPRLATRAVLVTANDAVGSAALAELLKAPPGLPEDTRLVLIHALDPAAFAGVKGDAAWPAAMLAAVATEDLSRVLKLDILPLNQLEPEPIRALSLACPEIVMTCHGPPPMTLDEALALIASIFGR